MKQAGHTVIAALVLTFGASSCGGGTANDAANDADTDADPGIRQNGVGSPPASPRIGQPGRERRGSSRGREDHASAEPAERQVAVTWTARTTFTHQVAASLSDIDVGDCVLVRSDDADEASAPRTKRWRRQRCGSVPRSTARVRRVRR